MGKIAVARAQDFPPGERRILSAEEFTIGVFNIRGSYYAIRNRCPHQGAPLCRGRLGGMTVASRPYEYEYDRDGEIIKCPWHGWEFDVLTGRSVFNPHKVRVPTYEVSVGDADIEDDDVYIDTYPVTVEEDIVLVHV